MERDPSKRTTYIVLVDVDVLWVVVVVVVVGLDELEEPGD